MHHAPTHGITPLSNELMRACVVERVRVVEIDRVEAADLVLFLHHRLHRADAR